MLKSPKRKGSELEYYFRDLLIKHGLDKFARRSIMSGAVFEAGDIKSTTPFFYECKNYQKMAIYKIWNQAKREAAGSRKNPAIVLKANLQPVLVALDADEFCVLLTYALASGYPDSEIKK